MLMGGKVPNLGRHIKDHKEDQLLYGSWNNDESSNLHTSKSMSILNRTLQTESLHPRNPLFLFSLSLYSLLSVSSWRYLAPGIPVVSLLIS
jgi:hypothetical protein